MKIVVLKNTLLIGVVACLAACLSYTDELREVQVNFRAGQYDLAMQKLDQSDLKQQARNRLLYLLEKASVLDRQGDRQASRQLLLQADRVVDQLYTSSITKSAASYVYNDAIQDYPGEDYEKVAIHTLLAHSFIQDGLLKEARIEAARINTRLNEINDSYDNHKNRYSEDAYARYLSGMIYENLGEYDNAIVDYRAALKTYESEYTKLFSTTVPNHLPIALYRLLLRRNRKDDADQLRARYRLPEIKSQDKDMLGELVVVHELGNIAGKERDETMLPIGNEIVRLSFPVIRHARSSFGRTGVQLDEDKFISAELAQNLDLIARETLEDRRGRIIAKSAARLILKSQMTQKAEREFGPLGWLAGNLYGAVTETADTRSWLLLPAAIEISRIQLKPGTYQFKFMNDGKVSGFKKNVQIKAGAMVIIRDY